MMIYVSHPYGGDSGNKEKIECIVRELATGDPKNTYISPVHCFGFLYDSVSYERGIEMCLDLLEFCDRMEVYGEWKNSKGCQEEINYCLINKIPYVIIE